MRCTRNGLGIHGHVANRIRYAERLLPLGRHARNSHVRRQQYATTGPNCGVPLPNGGGVWEEGGATVGWPLGGRDNSNQLTKLSQMLQMLGTGGCVLLQMSPLILPRQTVPVVTAVQCQCEVTLAVAAWLSQG